LWWLCREEIEQSPCKSRAETGKRSRGGPVRLNTSECKQMEDIRSRHACHNGKSGLQGVGANRTFSRTIASARQLQKSQCLHGETAPVAYRRVRKRTRGLRSRAGPGSPDLHGSLIRRAGLFVLSTSGSTLLPSPIPPSALRFTRSVSPPRGASARLARPQIRGLGLDSLREATGDGH